MVCGAPPPQRIIDMGIAEKGAGVSMPNEGAAALHRQWLCSPKGNPRAAAPQSEGGAAPF